FPCWLGKIIILSNPAESGFLTGSAPINPKKKNTKGDVELAVDTILHQNLSFKGDLQVHTPLTKTTGDQDKYISNYISRSRHRICPLSDKIVGG
ncbi:hypothetical protein HAX54_003851, partial [Datura stramonium]|nr:hypothetical protein [Datura stramonium]